MQRRKGGLVLRLVISYVLAVYALALGLMLYKYIVHSRIPSASGPDILKLLVPPVDAVTLTILGFIYWVRGPLPGNWYFGYLSCLGIAWILAFQCLQVVEKLFLGVMPTALRGPETPAQWRSISPEN